MPDKKPTDNEIVKDLKIHLENRECVYCGREDEELAKVINNALDLINRLETKNSNLTSDLTSLKTNLTSLEAENERLKPFEDKIAEFNSHIRVENMLVFASSLEEWLEFCDNLKAEAITEFVSLLCERFRIYQDLEILFKKDLEDLLKELVGEDNA